MSLALDLLRYDFCAVCARAKVVRRATFFGVDKSKKRTGPWLTPLCDEHAAEHRARQEDGDR